MNTIDYGGPAFPAPYSNEADGPTVMPSAGISLRDYFAAKAMAAMLTQNDVETRRFLAKQADPVTYISETAYRVADAMLKARATGAHHE